MKKKQGILDKIALKEEIPLRAGDIRKRQKLNSQVEHMKKQIKKENKVKQTAQLQENKKNETRQRLNEKDEKVEEFMQQKRNLIEQKRIVCDQINKQKQKYSEQFQMLFNKER